MENFSNSIPDIASAVTLTRLMASLMDRAESETMPSKISKTYLLIKAFGFAGLYPYICGFFLCVFFSETAIPESDL